MEIVTELMNTQLTLCLPVALVIVGMILLFTFGFKSAEQPPFDKLTDDRKLAGKKKKIKEKKVLTNGHISSGESKTDKSPIKETKRSPIKDASEAQKPKERKSENKSVEKSKKNEVTRSKTLEEVKNKKNVKKSHNEKPVDFDEGDWEMVPTKADKKKKQELSPAKKEAKPKKQEKNVEVEKMAKEIVNKELRVKDNENKVAKSVEEVVKNQEVEIVEEAPVIEEKKDKKKEKKIKTEKAPVIKEQALEKESPKAKVEKIAPVEIKMEASNKAATVNDGGVAFDELGDVWTEAKAAKKSKKKPRRDN